MPSGWGARHTLAVLSCLGFFVAFALRVNMSMAIVAMVNGTALSQLSLFNVTAPAGDRFCPGNRTFLIGNDLKQVSIGVTVTVMVKVSRDIVKIGG